MDRTCRNLIAGTLLVTLGSLGWGCATTHPRQGQSGHFAWEAICCVTFGYDGWSFTVVLRETAGIGGGFTSVKLTTPPSSGVGGVVEHAFVRAFGPHGEVRQNFSITSRGAPYVELEFRGVEDGRAFILTLLVYRR